jgi:hypothetical protein
MNSEYTHDTEAAQVCRPGILLETLNAVLQGAVYLEDIMQLKEFEKFHDFSIDITNLKEAIIIIRGFHD